MSSKTNEPYEGLSQVREILVGAVQRDLERRVGRVESHATARLSELQQEVRRRTDVIETHLRKESEALSGRFERETAETKEGLRGLMREHREAFSALEQRVAKIEENLARVQHELRDQILEQTKSFLDEAQRLRTELTDRIDREIESLELEKENLEESVPSEPYEDEQRSQH